MRLSEIEPYVDFDRISDDLLQAIYVMIDRWDGPADDDDIEMQYSDPLYDLQLAQAEATLAKTKAEMRRAHAQATGEIIGTLRGD